MLENLALRDQLSVLQRKSNKPRLKDWDRILWTVLSCLWTDWRKPLVLVQPETVIRWHRKGFRSYWKWKSRPKGLGRPKVAREIRDLVSIDFFTVPTATFRILFVFLVLHNDRRRVIHFSVTESPTAAGTGQQMIEAFPWDAAPRFLVRDRDGIYGDDFVRRVGSMGTEQVVISARSPWQNPLCGKADWINPNRYFRRAA